MAIPPSAPAGSVERRARRGITGPFGSLQGPDGLRTGLEQVDARHAFNRYPRENSTQARVHMARVDPAPTAMPKTGALSDTPMMP